MGGVRVGVTPCRGRSTVILHALDRRNTHVCVRVCVVEEKKGWVVALATAQNVLSVVCTTAGTHVREAECSTLMTATCVGETRRASAQTSLYLHCNDNAYILVAEQLAECENG